MKENVEVKIVSEVKSVEEILEDFKVYLLETGQITSQMTIQSYLSNIKQLLEWLEESNKTIDNLDRVLTLKYLGYLKNRDYKPNTYNTKVNSLTNFNNYLKDKDVIVKDIVFGKDKIQLSGNRQVQVYSDKEIELIEGYLEGENISQRDRLIIKMLKELGVRVSELTSLRLENIDLIGLQVEVQGKNNKIRQLPIKSILAEDIKKYIAGERKDNKHSNSPYLFISERSSCKPIHRNTVLELVKNITGALGIDGNCHKFRHTLATRMSNRNVPIQVIQQFLGHSEIQTTIEFYVNIETEQLRAAIED